MKILEKKYDISLNLFLLAISSMMIFRKPCTWIIIVFVLFGILFYKKIKLSKTAINLGLIISSPLLLEILFFWNNNSLALGLKSMEKSISLLIFPLLILGNYKRVDLLKLLQGYSVITTCLLFFYFIRFIVLYPENIHKYLNGIHLWEMGYVFSNTIGIHAPALNMHLAFVCIICFYLIFLYFKEKRSFLIKTISIILFLFSFFFVLFVNTRMALFQTLFGFFIVFFYQAFGQYSIKKILLIFTVIAFIISVILYFFVKENPYMKEKYSSITFAYMDKVGKLDDIKDPQIVVFNSLVTRVSIWKSAIELSNKNLPFGVGSSDGKPELVKYFKKTNQKFLAKYEFPTHNQYIDFLLKFGILGILVVIFYIATIGYIGYKTKSSIIVFFFFLFLTSNLTDDFLIRFDGIVFSGFWFSIFGAYWLEKFKDYKVKQVC
jgi:O-antigen ligase